MRLTLRTLLAYLDDTLPAAQAKEIGTQIGAVPEAAMLMRKLQDVIRKRRLLAPNLTGPGSGPDPNIVGEYLESSLDPSSVVELETLCYKSDMHLAEVAASHKILTLVLGEPVEVPQSIRERMYALGETDKPKVTPGAGVATAPPDAAQEPPLFEDGIPSYLKSQPTGTRTFAIIVGLVVFAGWAALAYPELSAWWNGTPTTPDAALAVHQVQPEENDIPDNDVPAPPANVNNDPEPGDKQPAVVPQPENVEAPPEPMPEMPDPVQPKPVVENPPQPPQPQAIPQLPVVYMNMDEVLLARTLMEPDWTYVTAPYALPDKSFFAVPHPFFANLNVGEGRLKLELLGGTLIERLPLMKGETLAIGIDRGQMKLLAGTEELPMRIRLVVGDRAYLLDIQEPETLVGIEVDLPAAEGLPGEGRAPKLIGGIQVGRGKAKLQMSGDANFVDLTPELGRTYWGTANPAATLPPFGWLLGSPPVTSIAKRNAWEFRQEFSPEFKVGDSIGPVVDNRLETKSEFAVQTMALTDNLPGLVRGLLCDHEASRIAAIEALRRWIVRDPNNEAALVDELSRSLHDDDVKIVVRLLWGYTEEDGRDPEISKQVVGWLSHEEVSVRELAFYHALHLTGRRYDYRALLLPNQRAAAQLRWQEHLDQYGALVH
ncbi:MAG: hypothetical protein H6824_18725 [Planctomycetaceae bacterium]|nr:hypothetical protein [Planctomycetaceae bacterium]